MNSQRIYIFTDGSFNTKIEKSGYGFVFVTGSPEEGWTNIYEGKGTVDAPESRQIVGECQAVVEACRKAMHDGYKHITICYDYNGVEGWIDGLDNGYGTIKPWKADKPVAKNYVRQINELKSKYRSVKLDFIHVKGHSDNRWNDLADSLASEALKDEINRNHQVQITAKNLPL